LTKKPNKINDNKNNDVADGNEHIEYDLDEFYTLLKVNNNIINFNIKVLNTQIYENNFYDIIKIGGDGNCLFRTISMYLYGTEELYSLIRAEAYKYISNNINKFYEYCYVQNDIYYIDIEENNKIKKYILDDYINNIQKDGFYAGFLELNAISIIYNRPIVIFDILSYKSIYYYNKLMIFNHNEKENVNIEEVIFINLKNKNHFQLMKPNKEFILDRINKVYSPINNIITFNKQKNKIIKVENKRKEIQLNHDKFNVEFISDIKNNDNKIENQKNFQINSNKKDNNNIVLKKNLLANTIDFKDINNTKFLNNEKDLNIKINKNSNNTINYDNKINEKGPITKPNNENFDINSYNIILEKIKNKQKFIYHNSKSETIIIPNYPILIGAKIDTEFYSDIYRYLYVIKYNLELSRYPENINAITRKNTKENKKRDFRKKANKFYLDKDNKLYKKFLIKANEEEKINRKYLVINNNKYILKRIPEKLDIIEYLNDLHIKENHRGILSLRNYLVDHDIYIEGSSFLTNYTIKNCVTCTQKFSSNLKKRPCQQIISFYPKQRYLMDLTELPMTLKSNNKYVYLFNIIDHFSKYGMSYLIENKESNTIYIYLKKALECNGYPEEIGCDNGAEFKNRLIENYLHDNNIKFIHGTPYNPHSQGVVERFHKTIKDSLLCLYSDGPDSFDIVENLDIVIKKYNNHIHRSTKYSPNKIFYSDNQKLFEEVLLNIKNSFKYFSIDNSNFSVDDKCLLKPKFKIQKKFSKNKVGILKFDKMKNKNIFGKINVIVLSKVGANYKIKIARDYDNFNLFENDLYLVDYNLLCPCILHVWKKLLEKDYKSYNNSKLEEILDTELEAQEDEIKFIFNNKNEYI